MSFLVLFIRYKGFLKILVLTFFLDMNTEVTKTNYFFNNNQIAIIEERNALIRKRKKALPVKKKSIPR